MASYVNVVANPNMQVTASLQETISDIRNAFLSCSFTRTVQSGSVDDISTLIPVAGFNSQIAYDIFSFNDVWQSTHPLFVKVRYMTGHHNTHLQLACQMGSVHNNSGSLIGVDTLTEIVFTAASSSPRTVIPASIHGCGDGSFMSLLAFPQLSRGQGFVFERLYDINGQPTGSGFHMFGNSTEIVFYSQTTLHGAAPATRETAYIPNSRPSRTSGLYDGRLVLGMVYPFAGRPWNPTPNILMGTANDFPNTLQPTRYTMYGTVRDYAAMSAESATTYDNNRILLRVAP